MKHLPISALILGALITGAWSANAGRYPLRQIDRPLLLPKGMWQENLVNNSYFTSNSMWFDAVSKTPEGFMPILPSYALTDNLLWEAVPGPLFRYLVTRNNVSAENGLAVKDFSLTVDGGLLGLTYSQRESTVFSKLGMTAKKPLLNWLWLEGKTTSYFDNADLAGISNSAGLGLQVTDRTYLTSRYSFDYVTDMRPGWKEAFYNGLGLGAGFNFTHNVSLGLRGFMMKGASSRIIFNPGADLSFQW